MSPTNPQSLSPDERARALEGIYATAHWLLGRERFKDAADVFRAMVTAAPEDERGWVGLGMCHEGADQLRVAKEIALSHHERWDGTGYPAQLAGEEIPLSARLMAVADVYDSLISRRVYKEPMNHENAVKIVVENRETQFDPYIIDAFTECLGEFQSIAERYNDTA